MPEFLRKNEKTKNKKSEKQKKRKEKKRINKNENENENERKRSNQRRKMKEEWEQDLKTLHQNVSVCQRVSSGWRNRVLSEMECTEENQDYRFIADFI